METELSTPKTRRESEVWQACDDLWAQTPSARSLTGDNIRDQLIKLGYKRGSPNEIYRYRGSWKESRGISDTAEASADGEVKASDPISRAVSLVYDQMRSQTSDAIERLTEDYEAQLKASLIEEETLKEEIARITAVNETLQRDLASMRARAAESEAGLSEERRNIAILNERIRGASEKVELVTTEHKALIVELKTFHEREIDLWRGQIGELTRAVANQKKQAQDDAERQGAMFSDALMKVKTELRQTIEEREQARARLIVMEEALKEARARAALLEEKAEDRNNTAIRVAVELDGFRKSLEAEHKEKTRWQRIVGRYLGNSRRSKRKRLHAEAVCYHSGARAPAGVKACETSEDKP